MNNKQDFTNLKKGEDIELLMPAGSLEKAKFAIEYGADAIYCGIPMFTLRGKSTMSMADLKELMPYARKRGVKVFFAVNIFPHSFKYEQFLKTMEVMVNELKPDAFIMSDPGLIDVAKENWPEIVIHLSVQANNVNWMSANFWYKQGIKRVILARELTLIEVEEISKRVPNLELEFFIHGSNCVAYSGRCLLSNYFNYRDSNQGVCNNACRFKFKLYKGKNFEPLGVPDYKKLGEGTYYVEEQLRKGELYEIDENEDGSYLLNARDNCMAEYLEKLINAGVMSFKVEGRTKSIYYSAIVARTYRKLFDDILAGEKPDINWAIRELNTTSNRGFTPGFLEGNPKQLAIDYEKKCSHQTHLFAGVVRNVIGKREKKVDTIVFDFDGVLVDTFDASYRAIVNKIPDATIEDFKDLFRGNIYKNKKFANRDESFYKEFYDFYEKRILDINPNRNVVKTLSSLKENYKLVINSSTPKVYIEKYLKKHNMLDLFDEIMGAETSKSKLEKFELIFDKYNTDKESCLFVTDTVGDVAEAKKIGIETFGVEFGFHDKDELVQSGVFRTFDNFNKLENYINLIDNKTFTKIEVEVRSRFEIGDKLEFIMPMPRDIENYRVHKILKPQEKELKKVSGGLGFNIILEVPFEVKEYCVIRPELKEGEEM